MKDVQCYELFGGIARKNHAFSFFNSCLREWVCLAELTLYVHLDAKKHNPDRRRPVHE